MTFCLHPPSSIGFGLGLFSSDNRASILVVTAQFELPNLRFLHLVRMLRLELGPRLNVVFTVVVAFDYADDIIALGIGEGYVRVPAEWVSITSEACERGIQTQRKA